MATDVTIPALGESITEATVGEWLKAPGDAVAVDEPIVSLETDKVAVEVPSPVAGTMGEQLFKVGDTVNVGALIARIESGAGAPAKRRPRRPRRWSRRRRRRPPAADSAPPAPGRRGRGRRQPALPRSTALSPAPGSPPPAGGTGDAAPTHDTPEAIAPGRPPPARRLQSRSGVDHRHGPRRAADQGRRPRRDRGGDGESRQAEVRLPPRPLPPPRARKSASA